ncbi:ribbon-helix-helix domain-containing protein [Lactiplantibacillus pentosus]|uniref:ribbon-helix-helix domain-containing protein n=1 Tax=Lactiplantibacillus pentosus TaxID=1589 RepID=UPI003C16A81D
MSLDTFNQKKDEEMRENYETTLKDGKKDNAAAFLKNISRKEVERKRSVTFSITESQLNKMDKAARQNGFKNRSEFLASIIDAI